MEGTTRIMLETKMKELELPRLRLYDIETGVYLAAMLVLIWVLSDCELCRVTTSFL